MASKPIDVNVQLIELTQPNNSLPVLQSAFITVRLDNETKQDTIHSFSDIASFANVPHSFIGENVKIKIQCRDFIPIDTTVLLQQNMLLGLQRDTNVYGNIHLRVWSASKGRALENYPISIAGQDVVSDKNGYVTLYIPLHAQKTEYEVVGKDVIYNKISMPCGDSDIILVQ